MRADVHLTAYKQRITPVVRGEVIQISADRLTDIERKSLLRRHYPRRRKRNRRIVERKTLSGNAGDGDVPTIERTAFDYLVSPLTGSFSKAFRQR